jgi:hypothetical protein
MSVSEEAKVFDFLKKKTPGDTLVITLDGREQEAFLIRRGRQRVRVKLKSSEELVLIPLSDIPLSQIRETP